MVFGRRSHELESSSYCEMALVTMSSVSGFFDDTKTRLLTTIPEMKRSMRTRKSSEYTSTLLCSVPQKSTKAVSTPLVCLGDQGL